MFYISVKPLPYYLVALILLTGCDREPTNCDDISFTGEFFLLEESENFIPYTKNNSRIIFSDSMGNEYQGLITRDTVLSTRSLLYANCPLDEEMDSKHSYISEHRFVDIFIEELNIRFRCSVNVNIGAESNSLIETKDELSVIFSIDNESYYHTSLTININNRNGYLPHINTSILHDNYLVHGRNYENVYSHNDNYIVPDDWVLLYSQTEGVIAIKNLIDSEFSYKYERIE